ncbi:hypothetical protein DFH06DRAFT_1339847 [Mycena polygramma]|nr:hypothetical protein DFH06DRAFT_1339847 [Mycena polygramma]
MSSNNTMSLWEAHMWSNMSPEDDELRALFPTLADDKRKEAWVDRNRENIREGMKIFLAVHADEFAPGVSIDPSGSLFGRSQEYLNIPVYWDPATITWEHEGFVYSVPTPQHVAALHATRTWPTALAYIQAHHDSRTAVGPMVFNVPAVWHPDVCPHETHPDAPPGAPHDANAFPTWRDAQQASKGKGKVRYTLYGWRKDFDECLLDWRARQHYFSKHYDLKEVLDDDGRVVSSEHGMDRLLEGPARL